MKKLIFLFFLFALSAPLTAVLAQEPVAFDFPPPESHDIARYINSFYNTAVLIAGIVAVAMIVIGAIYYITSGGSPDKQREGKDIITSAIWGVVLLLGAYVILNTINPELVSLRLGAPELKISVDICKPADERDECEPEEESDPEAHGCCIPYARAPVGLSVPEGIPALTLTVCSAKLEECEREYIIAAEGSWTGELPACGKGNALRSCQDGWEDLKGITIHGEGGYREWAYYPKNLEGEEENIKCVVYAWKGTLTEHWTSGGIGPIVHWLPRTYDDWQYTDRDGLKSCPGL